MNKMNDYIRNGWHKHDVFAEILRTARPHKEYRAGDYIVLRVTFESGDHTYCYLARDNVYKVGDFVRVETWQGSKAVKVQCVDYYSEKTYPFKEVELNYVVGPADEDLKNIYLQVRGEREAAERDASKPWKHIKPATDNEYIIELRDIQNEMDEDEEIYLLLDKLEDKISKLTDKAAQVCEEDASDSIRTKIDKFYDCYLPNTLKMLEQYKAVFTSGLPEKSIQKIRQDIVEAIDYAGQAYDNILESLYEKDFLALASEIEALKFRIASEGLLDSDFDIK